MSTRLFGFTELFAPVRRVNGPRSVPRTQRGFTCKKPTLSKLILDAAFRVHSAVGPGLLESAYEACLAYELRSQGLKVLTQVPMPISYGEVKLDVGYSLDVLVEDLVLVEVKSVDALAAIHHAQLLSYLELSGHKLDILIHFNCVHLKHGIKRVVNGL